MTRTTDTDTDTALLEATVDAVRAAGARLLAGFDPTTRPTGRADIVAAVRRNEDASLDGLRDALAAARPGAGWVSEAEETTALPPGEWWAVDAVEGNVNHVHGAAEWGVSATLLRDGEPVLTAVHQPVGDLTRTAVRGRGALVDGVPLRASAKTVLADAIVGTGQAEAGQRATYRRIGDSITALLERALLVRASVPSTFPMLLVAGGQQDAFWQYEPVLPGVAAGVLLVTEAGGVASRIDGSPWRPGDPDVLVTAPGVHAAVVDALSAVGTGR